MSESISLAPRGRKEDFRDVTCPRCGRWTTTESQDLHNQSYHATNPEWGHTAERILKKWDADPSTEPGYGRGPGRARGVN
jgi:hypothetical protein